MELVHIISFILAMSMANALYLPSSSSSSNNNDIASSSSSDQDSGSSSYPPRSMMPPDEPDQTHSTPYPQSIFPSIAYRTHLSSSYPSLPAVATQTQSVIRSLDGNSVYSSYSKAVDTPHSSIRKYDSRITNDAATVIHTPVFSAHHLATHHQVAPVYHHTPTYVIPTYHHHSVHPVYHHAAPAAVYHHPITHPVSHITFDGFGTHYAL